MENYVTTLPTVWLVIIEGLTLKSTNFYNIEKHINRT